MPDEKPFFEYVEIILERELTPEERKYLTLASEVLDGTESREKLFGVKSKSA